jgi:ligand-binding sensor domain-containing protein
LFIFDRVMAKIKHKLWCFAVFLMLLVKAQQPSYIHFNVNNGLPSNNAYYVMQDKNGYFWISTDKGVAKFNGYAFQTYSTNDGLSDNEIFDVYEDAQHRLWFACYNGELPYFKNHVFYNRGNDKMLAKLSRYHIGLKVMSDRKGTVYYLSQRAIAVIAANGIVTENLPNELGANATLVKNDKAEVISISYDTSMVYFTNLTTNERISFSHAHKQVMPLINTKADMIGNSVFYSVSDKLIRKDFSEAGYTVAAGFGSMIQYVKKAGPEALWVGTQKGLFLFDLKQHKVTKELFKEYSVSCVFEDNEKHLWVSTLDGGVFLVINQNVELLNGDNGLNFNTSLSFAEITKEKLLIGSNKFKFAIIEKGQVKNITLPESNGNGLIRSARTDPNGNLFIVTAVNIYKLDPSGKILNTYHTAVRDMLFADTDSLYVARINGISKIKVTDLDLHRKNLDAFLLKHTRLKHGTNYFYSTPNGDIYCVGNKGIKLMNGLGSKAIEQDTLFKNNISGMVQSKDGAVFISSDINGIKVVYKNVSTYINNKTGLPSNFVTSLVLDNHSNLWAGTSSGLVKISYSLSADKFTYTAKSYSTINGLIDNAINDIALYQGKLWLATNFGVCSFKESELQSSSKAPQMNIESVLLNDSVLELAANATVISPYHKNNFKIKYAGISSGSLNNILYRYRMTGLDENWSTTGNVQLQYPSLPPGKYTFEIAALNQQGNASATQKVFITITPAFYQTLWFKTAAVIFIALLLVFIVMARLSVWRKNHELKESLLSSENRRLSLEKEEINMQMKLLELEQKALRLHMNPHFIFNAINAINGFYASGEAETGKKYIGKLSQLLRMLLDFSSQKFISVRQEVELLTNYFLLNQLRFQNKFDFEIDVDKRINPDRIAIPPMIIQPFVENALIHGIAPLKTKGEIYVRLSVENGYLKCEIRDNGIGMKKSGIINKDRIHTSTGIKITEERIRTNYSGTDANFQIWDDADTDGNSKGTHVTFKLNLEELY